MTAKKSNLFPVLLEILSNDDISLHSFILETIHGLIEKCFTITTCSPTSTYTYNNFNPIQGIYKRSVAVLFCSHRVFTTHDNYLNYFPRLPPQINVIVIWFSFLNGQCIILFVFLIFYFVVVVRCSRTKFFEWIKCWKAKGCVLMVA